MLQTFDATTNPEQGPPRLQALRSVLHAEDFDGFLVPRADVHQGEYVADRDARLSWLTGFTGSAGFAVILADKAGVFVDGRYRVQVKSQVSDVFTPVDWPETQLGPWLKTHLSGGARVAYDPWLHTVGEMERYRTDLKNSNISLVPTENFVDRIWEDQPAPPNAAVVPHPLDLAGKSAADKRNELAADLQSAGHDAAVITLPDSAMWLLNIRGSDIARNPLAHCFAILHADARVDLFIAPAKIAHLGDHLGTGVTQRDPDSFASALAELKGRIRLDKNSAPEAIAGILKDKAVFGSDLCALAKARKNPAEIKGTINAHIRDGAAVTTHLAWLAKQAPGSLTEIDVVQHLETCRRRDNSLRDISFETIAGTGANGAIMHYRVTEGTNRTLENGDLLVLDSGGQYPDGTTDITRTLAIGTPGAEERAAFTRVLQGMIAMSRLVWPKGLAGRDLDAIARAPLWAAGQDYNHGTGHGVGAYLCVHEGPQRLAKTSHVPLEPGMILSNEPGYYRNGAFGIRIENLLVVKPADIPGGDPERSFLCWRTLTLAPIDRTLIDTDMLSVMERDWLNAYHQEVEKTLAPLVADDARTWLASATAPL